MMNKYIILIFSLVFAFISCNNDIQPNLKNDIEEYISNKIDKSSTTPLKIYDITNFEWDKFFVITPYFQKEEIEKLLGVKLIYSSAIYSSDDIALLIFLYNNKIVKAIDFPRINGDFTPIYKDEGYKKNEAIFNIRVDANWIFIEN